MAARLSEQLCKHPVSQLVEAVATPHKTKTPPKTYQLLLQGLFELCHSLLELLYHLRAEQRMKLGHIQTNAFQ